MQQNNYLRLALIAGFLAFAGISCWATAESLHMLLSSWPKIMCWIVTVGFFIIASIGTKMIVDSLNTNIFIEKRGMRLCGGILIVLIFWLGFSFPTNTHTFFYRSAISDKVTTDISVTRGYLNQIEDNTDKKAQAQIKIEQMDSRVTQLLNDLTGEIWNYNNPGFGAESKRILGSLATELGVPEITPLSVKGTSKQDLQRLCDAYRSKVMRLKEDRAKAIMADIQRPNKENIREAKAMNEDLGLMQKYIAEGTINLNDPEQMTGPNGVCNKLNEAYNLIKKNRNFVNFSNKTDEEQYTAPEPMTKVRRMISVIDVWSDYLHGKYAGYGFVTWILLSVLADVAAFIFFDLI